MVARLGIFKHHAVSIIRLAADYGQTVAVTHVQILLIQGSGLLHRHEPLAVDNLNMEMILQIAVDSSFCDLVGHTASDVLPEITVVHDQRPLV